jgi:uncharacterized protein YggE
MLKNKVLAAAGAAMILAPCAVAQEAGQYVRPYWWDKPVVEGLGRALIEVAPNRARFDLAFVETDAKSDEAMKKAVQRSKIAYDAIKKVAGDKARVTTSVNVDAYFKQYRDKDGVVQTNQRADQVEGYQARVSMTVLLTDPALAGRARAAALALGPQDMNPIYIFLEQTTDMQRRALDEAAKDARARAQLIATAAGARLGDLLVTQEGNDSCMGNWSSGQVARSLGGDNYYPSPVYAPPPPPPPPPAPSPQVAQGQVGRQQITISERDLAGLDLPSDASPQTMQASVCMIWTLVK